MNPRICSNPSCRILQPQSTCTRCNTPTHPLPAISLSILAITGTIELVHSIADVYSLKISTANITEYVTIHPSDMVPHSPPHPPGHLEASDVMIMEALWNASTLITTLPPDRQPRWVTYLIELLQDKIPTPRLTPWLHGLYTSLSALQGEDEPSPEEP